ncbi:MAG TPA: hypothetical protein VFI06_08495 [Chitinophagaceae bacterium]|nr:hypothetical protein [Chitinophagaceae bacterium]
MKILLWLIYIIPLTGLSQSIKFRQYKKGEHFQYQLTTESFRNNQPDSKTISISHHTIVDDSGRLAEEIKWISKKSVGKETAQLDSTAQKVPPYKISLQPGGRLKIPALTIPEMTGEITDLNTFYVAVSPALHIHKLDPGHLSFIDSVLKGNFADGKQIINGEDCIQVKQRLLIKDKKTTTVETSFLPPFYTGITPYIDTIGKQSFEVPNNFQMVRKGAGDKVNLLWGVEKFIITSTIDNRTGMILQAEMINLLNLRMRYNASADLSTYDGEIPLTIKRVLHLELLK